MWGRLVTCRRLKIGLCSRRSQATADLTIGGRMPILPYMKLLLRANDVVGPAGSKLIRGRQEWIQLFPEYPDGAARSTGWWCEFRIQDLGDLVARAFQMRPRFSVGRLCQGHTDGRIE